MTAPSHDSKVCVLSLLGEHPFNGLRRLELSETAMEIVITGVVNSYFLKQMAQEAIRPALAGRRLRNKVIVVPAN